MKKLLFFVLILGLSISAWADNKAADPVLLTIGDNQIPRSEFEYYLNKHARGGTIKDQKVISNYLALFTNFKLKAIEARKQKLDADSAFQKEFALYRNEQLAPHFMDTVYIDSVCKMVYKVANAAVGDSDVLSLQHIVITYPVKGNAKLKDRAKAKADSLYQCLLKGETFEVLARKYSNDRTSALKAGKLPWVGPNPQQPVFTKNVYAAPLNKIVLFEVPNGYEIVRVLERRPFGNYASQKGEILRLLKEGGIEVQAFHYAVKKKVEASKGKQNEDKVIAQVMEDVFKKDTNLKYKVWEYFESLLSQKLTDMQPWKETAKMTAELEAYFQKNKSLFTWDKPRFKGWVISTRTEELLPVVKEIVQPYTSKKEAREVILENLGAVNAKKVIVNYGVYKEGADYRVDNKVFGKNIDKKSKFAPYYDVLGEQIKGPQSYMDDRNMVITAFQNTKEAEWMRTLMKKYAVHVDKSVLQTVNNH